MAPGTVPLPRRLTRAKHKAMAKQVVAPTWAPNTTIMDMPNEVLREIFLSIDGEFSCTLHSLSLTCKHFRNVVEKYCEPEYNLRGKWIEDPYALMERIWAQPHLKRILRVLRMEYNFIEYTQHTYEQIEDLRSRLNMPTWDLEDDMYFCPEGLDADTAGPVWLGLLLPKVETIELLTRTAKPRTYRVPLIGMLHDYHVEDMLHSHGFVELRNLTLVSPQMGDGDLNLQLVCPTSLMFPSLRKVKLVNCEFDNESWSFCYPRPRSVSRMTDLEIHEDQSSFIDPQYFSESYTMFKTLKVLRLHIKHSYWLYDDHIGIPRYVCCLKSLANLLEDLQLYSNEQYQSSTGSFEKLVPHCLAQPHLRHFQKLRSLSLTDMSLVGVSENGPNHWQQSAQDTRKHLVNMFPLSLRTFTHVLWDGPTSFSSEGVQKSIAVWKDVWETQRYDRLRKLHTVMVQRYGPHGLSGDSEVIWRNDSSI